MPQDKSELELNPELLSTKELLRQKRKQEYELAKTLRKEERLSSKEEEKRRKKAAQEARDKELWNALRPASLLSEEP